MYARGPRLLFRLRGRTPYRARGGGGGLRGRLGFGLISTKPWILSLGVGGGYAQHLGEKNATSTMNHAQVFMAEAPSFSDVRETHEKDRQGPG